MKAQIPPELMPPIARPFRIVAKFHLFANFGEDFLFQKFDILRTGGIIFKAPIGTGFLPRRRCGDFPGIDKHDDGERQFPLGDEIVEHSGRAKLSFFVQITAAVLKHHQTRQRTIRLDLSGDIDPIIALGPRKNFARVAKFGDTTLGDPRLLLGIRPEFVRFLRPERPGETPSTEEEVPIFLG